MKQVVFYKTKAGNEVVLNFIRGLPANDKKTIGEDLATLQHGYPLGMPMCRHLVGDLWELRSSMPSKREARLIYFYHSASSNIVVVHGFIKKTQKTPANDIDLAQKRRAEFS
jgi:phage-related protein